MEYFNSQSNWFDKFLTPQLKKINDEWGFKINRTYFWYDSVYKKGKRHIAFRVPGATRGHVEVSKYNIITDVVIYDETCFRKGSECYIMEILDHIHELKGISFDMNGFTDKDRFNKEGKEIL